MRRTLPLALKVVFEQRMSWVRPVHQAVSLWLIWWIYYGYMIVILWLYYVGLSMTVLFLGLSKIYGIPDSWARASVSLPRQSCWAACERINTKMATIGFSMIWLIWLIWLIWPVVILGHSYSVVFLCRSWIPRLQTCVVLDNPELGWARTQFFSWRKSWWIHCWTFITRMIWALHLT